MISRNPIYPFSPYKKFSSPLYGKKQEVRHPIIPMQTVISLYLLAKQVMSDNFFMPAHSKGTAVVYIKHKYNNCEKNRE